MCIGFPTQIDFFSVQSRPTPLTQPIRPQAAADRLGASNTATITHGRHQGEEASFPAFPAEEMLEVEARPVSEAAATPTGEASLAEAGGGPGAAGRLRSPGSC
jgi:hypothetical protein